MSLRYTASPSSTLANLGVDIMEVVMVEFAVGKGQVKNCVDALVNLMNTLVADQANFHGATIYIEEDTGFVINAMKWDTHKDFLEFRDANLNVIGSAIGKFSPRPRWLLIEKEIESKKHFGC